MQRSCHDLRRCSVDGKAVECVFCAVEPAKNAVCGRVDKRRLTVHVFCARCNVEKIAVVLQHSAFFDAARIGIVKRQRKCKIRVEGIPQHSCGDPVNRFSCVSVYGVYFHSVTAPKTTARFVCVLYWMRETTRVNIFPSSVSGIVTSNT